MDMRKLQHQTDHELFLQIKEGDTAAYKEVYERYWQLLYVYAYRFLKDKSDAEDIVQEVFITLFTKKEILEVKSLSALLYTSVRNRVLKKFDHLKVRADYLASVKNLQEPGENLTEAQQNFNDLSRIIESELQKLPESTREVFVLSRIEEKSHKEISESLNLTKDVVKKRVAAAVKHFKHLKVKLQIFTGILP
ncbi:RNA polymerase sigma-70 factor [Chitinophaga barathri]|uniref:RNA polymerase sigma-70 factor n=2 Tax=Chitinophaga barathri TaxID=1647451 RepID=A0A3N4MGU9_9BACT|nr:RNA polymerase sigma-70 factor [Chitinophaga barathri]